LKEENWLISAFAVLAGSKDLDLRAEPWIMEWLCNPVPSYLEHNHSYTKAFY
jgi:hypothetical protein